MYQFLYDYVKPKYGEKARFCYMDTDSFIVYTKPDDIYNYIAENVETRFDTSDHELEKPLPKEKQNASINRRMQSNDSIETYAYGMSKKIVT